MNMDDAAGGRRGPRPAPSTELFDAVREAYGFDGPADPIDLGGSSSLNLLVGSGDDRRVLRVYRRHMTAGRLRDIHLARRELSAAGVPCPDLIPTRSGQPWLLFEGRLVEVERYVERDADMKSWERLELGLPILGRIHTIFRSLEVGEDGKSPLFANHIESSEVMDRTLRGTQRIRAWHPSAPELQLAAAAEELAHRVSSAEERFIAALPRQLVHGDFWDNNVFFRDGRVILVTDLDFMGERARIDDLALTLYFTCFEYPEEDVSDERLRRLRRLVDAYDAGLDEPLTPVERAALPLAMARQPLWSIGGWVALLDDEQTARRHAEGMIREVQWALGIIREVERWQAAFA
jgi:Ser/Thr protein kinase RdoA (MazF antagonist)